MIITNCSPQFGIYYMYYTLHKLIYLQYASHHLYKLTCPGLFNTKKFSVTALNNRCRGHLSLPLSSKQLESDKYNNLFITLGIRQIYQLEVYLHG